MERPPSEVVVAFLSFVLLWVLVVVGVLALAPRWERGARARDRLVAQWKPSLGIALLFLVSYSLGSKGANPLGAIVVFCQSLVGLSLARGIVGYDPLPVTHAAVPRKRRWRDCAVALGIAVLLVPAIQVAGGLGMGIGQLLGETAGTRAAMESFGQDRLGVFFLLLAGAGIAEETTYRLVLLSLLWRLTRRTWIAVPGSAVAFGIYHLTPLNGLYQISWDFPVSQVLASSLAGVVLGYVYVRRGFETVVLGHTLSNWIPLVVFTR